MSMLSKEVAEEVATPTVPKYSQNLERNGNECLKMAIGVSLFDQTSKRLYRYAIRISL